MVKRLFFAISIPEDCKQLLLQLFRKKDFHGIRWVSKENLHITIHFLGATSEESLANILERIPSICSPVAPFDLKFEDFSTVIKDKKPVMIWAKFEENKAYDSLCYALRKEFPTEENRKPLPHLTLARIKQLHQLPFDLPKAKSFSFVVNSVELWESHLNASGSTYKIIKHWALTG